MAESYFSELRLVQYLGRLTYEEFGRFKELLQCEPLKSQLPPIPWPEINSASEEELARFLVGHYPGRQVWDMTLSLLLQIDRKDLWMQVQEEMGNTSFAYRKHMREKFQQVWERETCLQVPDEFYKNTMRPQYTWLCNAFAHQVASGVTAVLFGPEGIGKTTLLRRLMLDWAEGTLWEGRFMFVFFFAVYEINSVVETSLAELVSRDWPGASAVIGEMFSQPERTLFILDGFEKLNFDLEIRTDLCTKWDQRRPTPVILSSLLQKELLPESSLLLGLRNAREMIPIHHLLKQPKDIMIFHFSNILLELYFSQFFHVPEHASAALEFVQSRLDLLSVCNRPIFCWMTCSCLKWQLESGDYFRMSAHNITSFYVSFLTSVFKRRYLKCSPDQNRAQLQSLCTLAAHGMWTRMFVFSCGDLAGFGVSSVDILLWLGLDILQPSGQCFIFRDLAMQSFLAAMFYFFDESTDADFGGVAQLVSAVLRDNQSHLFVEGVFVYGLTDETTRKELETSLGFLLSKNKKLEIMQALTCLRERGEAMSLPELFQGLMETRDEAFMGSVLDLFEEMSLTICEMDHFIVATSCLEHCRRLRTLRLCIHTIFQDSKHIWDLEEHGSNRTFRGHRGEDGNLCEFRRFCRVLGCIPDLQRLELHRFRITIGYLRILFSALANCTGSLQSLWSTFMPSGDYEREFFEAVLRSPYLRQVNLYGTGFEENVTILCDTLMKPDNTVEDLMLGKCNILTRHCESFSFVIKYQRLRCLSLVDNPIGNRGVQLLCGGLKDPNCILNTLMLSYCCLTQVACDYIAQALRVNRSLSLLDMGSNFLEDVGAVNLCKALRQPDCSLQELWLPGCYFTSGCCEVFSEAMTCNGNLKTLKLGGNKIQDSGVKLLCEALQHPKCGLQTLGLDMCPLTSDCCGDLAAALISCPSLRRLSLDWVAFDHAGVEALCVALSHQDCTLELLGLDKVLLDEDSQKLLEVVVENRVPPLTITHQPWLSEEYQLRGVPEL
ncbi:NACHT, LRR and PYD domains-containing protein 9 [Dipodomys spectabilis]|uniref:NACHT, LRR and PYD domains-containing protein 9 n=1 Tax=Dipodomys spectabilis TaxID=105255 RepID=UPI001C535F50|nr:NACHT, LRR and PYD domains-containing protein 9 [Dipodomys spectabilis]